MTRYIVGAVALYLLDEGVLHVLQHDRRCEWLPYSDFHAPKYGWDYYEGLPVAWQRQR